MAAPDLYSLMAAIALGLRQYDKAKHYALLAKAAQLPQTPRQRYLLIQPWGCGLWGEIDHVLSQLALAEITGRIPVVHWGVRGAYPVPGVANAWEAYFEPVADVGLSDIEHDAQSFFPSWWQRDTIRVTSVEAEEGARLRMSSLYFLGADEDVVVANAHARMLDILPWAPEGHWLASASAQQAYETLFARYIRLVSPLKKRVDEAAATLGPRPVLAIHFRAQTAEKLAESHQRTWLEPEDYFPGVDSFLHANPTGSLFLLTDLERCVDIFAARYGTRLQTIGVTRLAHESEIEIRFKADVDLRAAAEEVIVDAYVAARCDAFVGDGISGVSCAIGYMKHWAPGTFFLLRPSVIMAMGRIQPF
jgi:protein O-GlcNAc transferase